LELQRKERFDLYYKIIPLTIYRNLMMRLFTIPPGAESDPANQHIRRNFFANTLHQVTLFFGDSFVAYQTILPVYAATLTQSPILIGLVPAIIDTGWFLPQLFFAPVIERLPRRKPLVLALGVVERLPYLLLAFIALWLPQLEGNAPITIFLALIIWKALAGGFAGLPWQDFVAKVIPAWLRGRFFGIAHFGGKLLGLGAASLTGLILVRLEYPNNYALIFLLGFLMLSLSLVFFALAVEPDTPVAPRQPGGSAAYRAQLLTILKDNPNFRRYLLSRALSYAGSMAIAFIAVYALQRFQLEDAYAAVFTSILFAASTLGLLAWGGLNDRFGPKRVLIGSALLWSLALVVLLLWQTLPAVYLAFALIGLSQPGGIIGDLNMPMEFDAGPRRPTYIGLARTLTSPVILAAPVLAGVVVQSAGFVPMFAIALGFTLSGLALLGWGVRDPRGQRRTDLP
jgi:MFS family permease